MTQNDRAFEYYVRLLILVVAMPTLMLVIVGTFYFQPYWGPLTRLAGVLENDYGWNEPQEVHIKPLFRIAKRLSQYDSYYDVVVVGDSFSLDEKKGWQNYFVNHSGLSLITISHHIGLERVLESPMFRQSPPRILVVESLEQFALSRLQGYQSISALSPATDASPGGRPNNIHDLTNNQRTFMTRKDLPPLGTSTAPSTEMRVDQALHYAIKALQRRFSADMTTTELRKLWGTGTGLETDAYLLPLRSSAETLFSSRIRDKMLVYRLDIAKVTDAVQVKLAAQGALHMKGTIEANGITKVVLMLFPDKLNVYAPYLQDSSVAPPSIIPILAASYPSLLRLDMVFSNAIAEGVQDLYLPDDTHCGYKGYKLAAEQMVQAINRLGQ